MKKLVSEEVNSLLSSINDLIDIKILIRKIVPHYNFNDLAYKEFLSLLESLYKKINPIFSTHLNVNLIESKRTSIELKEKLFEMISEKQIALLSANSLKKKLKQLGVDPRNIIVSGGPLFVEDYKLVNPDLSDEVLEGITKKCQRLQNELKNKDWQQKDLIFIYEQNNPTDLLILEKLERVTTLIGKNVKTFSLQSWKVLDD